MSTILDCQNSTRQRRHVDQVQFNGSGQSEDIPTVVSTTNTTSLNSGGQSELTVVLEESLVTECLTE